MRHILDDVDHDAATATCRICGPVKILWSRGTKRWCCETKGTRDGQGEHLLTRYGITKERYAELYAEQGGRCAICDVAVEVLHVDHCHRAGDVRALLCGSCNRGLGLFADNPARLRAAAEYLERHA